MSECEGCGLEFDDSELDENGLCNDCVADYADDEEDDEEEIKH